MEVYHVVSSTSTCMYRMARQLDGEYREVHWMGKGTVWARWEGCSSDVPLSVASVVLADLASWETKKLDWDSF